MELNTYLRILIERWRVILFAFIVTLAATILFTLMQPTLYEAKNTFVLRPRSSLISNQNDFVRVLDTLSNRVEINATIAEVANSKSIKNLAISRLDLTPEEKEALQVNATVINGTNILEISVQGNPPSLVKNFVNAISVETIAYVNNLYDVFQLELLDEASVPKTPMSPKWMLNLAFGGILGLILGAGLAFLSEYLLSSDGETALFDIVDRETGVYNQRYLLLRLEQELYRSRRHNYPLSLSLLRFFNNQSEERIPLRIRDEAMRRMATSIEKDLREEDVVARIDASTYAILLPDQPYEEARISVKVLQSKMEKLIKETKWGRTIQSGQCAWIVVTYKNEDISNDGFLELARRTLEETESAGEEDPYVIGSPARRVGR